MVTETSEVYDLLCCRAGVNFDIEACSDLAPKPAVYSMWWCQGTGTRSPTEQVSLKQNICTVFRRMGISARFSVNMVTN
jgi:hypothetical protein